MGNLRGERGYMLASTLLKCHKTETGHSDELRQANHNDRNQDQSAMAVKRYSLTHALLDLHLMKVAPDIIDHLDHEADEICIGDNRTWIIISPVDFKYRRTR